MTVATHVDELKKQAEELLQQAQAIEQGSILEIAVDKAVTRLLQETKAETEVRKAKIATSASEKFQLFHDAFANAREVIFTETTRDQDVTIRIGGYPLLRAIGEEYRQISGGVKLELDNGPSEAADKILALLQAHPEFSLDYEVKFIRNDRPRVSYYSFELQTTFIGDPTVIQISEVSVAPAADPTRPLYISHDLIKSRFRMHSGDVPARWVSGKKTLEYIADINRRIERANSAKSDFAQLLDLLNARVDVYSRELPDWVGKVTTDTTYSRHTSNSTTHATLTLTKGKATMKQTYYTLAGASETDTATMVFQTVVPVTDVVTFLQQQ